jgi:vacuolar protein sorting-associated protein 13A/C
MVERVLLHVVERTLGRFVQQINQDKLKIGVWKGEIELDSLTLRPDALSHLGIPLTVCRGHVNKATLKVHWSKLMSEPMILNISGVHIHAKPLDASDCSNEDFVQHITMLKDSKVERLDAARTKQLMQLLASSYSSSKSAGAKEDPWVVRVASKVLHNLQISLTDLHIRYEHDFTSSLPRSPINQLDPQPRTTGSVVAIGLCIASMTAVSADSNWMQRFVDEKTELEVDVMRKLLRVEGMAVYCNVDAISVDTLNTRDFLATMEGRRTSVCFFFFLMCERLFQI